MTRIAVAGAGLIGTRHLAALRVAGIGIHSVIDPAPGAAAVAAEHDVPHFGTLAAGLDAGPDGLILATPNNLHREGAVAAIAAGVPVLVEKPIATTLEDAAAIVEVGEAAGVPVLTGHHRRHLPVMQVARERILSGAIGKPVAAHAMFWIAKPDGYFDTPWRREKGAGPLLMNAIHDLDMLRFLLGEVETVRAVATNRVRGHAVEDAAAAVLTFANGALGTLQCSDAVVAPWSYECTAHDNPAYPPTDENALWIGGTLGSIALPRGAIWHDDGRRDWWAPLETTRLLRAIEDPLVAQVRNLEAVIRGDAEPVCSGREGMLSLAVLEAVKRACETDGVVRLAE